MVEKKGWSRLRRMGSSALGASGRYMGDLLLDGFRGKNAKEEARRQRLARAGREMAAALGDLKGAAMKLGQILSSDPELLPPEMAKALTVLQRQAPPMPYTKVRQILESEWGDDGLSLFELIEEEPLGAASLGQVHKGRLKDGRQVAIKVQYPGIRDSLEGDLAQLKRLLSINPVANIRKQASAYVEELRERFLLESDYLEELKNLAEGAALFSFIPDLVVPTGVAELTTSKVLVMEQLEGKPLLDAFETMSQEERNRVGEILVLTWSGSFHLHQFVHGDTHPGNFMYLNDGRIGLLDFGCVRRFDSVMTDGFLSLLVATWEQRYDDLPQIYADLGFGRGDVKQRPEVLKAFGEIAAAPFLHDGAFDFADWPLREGIQRFVLEHLEFARMVPPPEALLYLRVLVGLRGLLHSGRCQVNVRHLAMNLARERFGFQMPEEPA